MHLLTVPGALGGMLSKGLAALAKSACTGTLSVRESCERHAQLWTEETSYIQYKIENSWCAMAVGECASKRF